MGMRVRTRNCWICLQPALSETGNALEPFEPNVTLQAVAHSRCLPLAELARRSVYRADGEKLGPDREPKLHLRTSGSGGSGTLLLCKNSSERMRRLGTLRDFSGVIDFSTRADACAVCARELAAQVEHQLSRRGKRARVVTSQST